MNRTRSAVAVSLLAIAAGCGGGASPSNQSATSLNVQENQPAASSNMLEPTGNGQAEAMPVGTSEAKTPAAEAANETDAPAAPANEKARNTAEPAARQAAVKPKEAQPPAQRNQAIARPAPRPTSSQGPKETCTPEHREMGHC
jgi:hypothetical protein